MLFSECPSDPHIQVVVEAPPDSQVAILDPLLVLIPMEELRQDTPGRPDLANLLSTDLKVTEVPRVTVAMLVTVTPA